MTRAILFTALLVLLSPQMLWAQAEVERFDRTLEQVRRDQRLQINPDLPVGQRTFIDYGAYVTTQWISLDDPRNANHAFWQEDLVGYAHAVLDGSHEFFFRGRLFHRDFNAGDRFSSDGRDIDGRVERAYYRFDLANYEAAYAGRQIDGDLGVKVGRDLVFWANGLTLNSEMDGAVIDLSRDRYSLQAIAGITPLDAIDFDSSRPEFDHKNKRALFGGMASVRIGEQKPFVYFLDQDDHNTTQIRANAADASIIPTKFRYNSHYLGIGSTGPLSDRLSYGVEAVYEGGDSLSRSSMLNASATPVAVPQSKSPIEAYAFDGRLDYAIPDEHATRLTLETIVATGDSDRTSTTNTVGGNKAGSKDRAFNGFGLLNVGVAFEPPVSNIVIVRAGASTFPLSNSALFRRLQVGTDLFVFGKTNSSAPLDEPTRSRTYLGCEPDLYLNWGITTDVTLAMRYGVFFPGDGIAGGHQVRQFLYTGLTIAF